MSKRILSLVLALVMVLGTFGTVFAAPTDNMRVDWLIEEGLVLGYGDGSYGLDKAITRAEVATMVVRALGLEEDAKKMENIVSVFPDMRGSNVKWANGYVNVAVGKGIINGYEDGSFKPSQDISYAEVAAILVRSLNGMTPEEIKAAQGRDWATTYLVRAAELGVLDDVVITDFNAKAQRVTIFEMVYNTINKGFGRFTIVKGIVLENNRVEKLTNSNEIVVEVLKEIQTANFASASRFEKGNQEKFAIEAKVGDVEYLLGKVADFTLDKDNKVVNVKVDESYEYWQGPITATKNKVNNFTVELDERYKERDERIFRTYHNDKPLSYEDFYQVVAKDQIKLDFARVTTKNGKVLFIDSFTFDDIAPVQEVKRDGLDVYVYNDYRDARVEKFEPRALVIGYKDGMFSRIERTAIKANDVVHVYSKDRMIVRLDAAVKGEYQKVERNRDNEYSIYVDGEAYLISNTDYRRPVYAHDSKAFTTLYAMQASRDLANFFKEQVNVLLDINNDLQLFGANVEWNEGMALVKQVLAKGQVKFIDKSDEELILDEAYTSTISILDSNLNVTINQRLNLFNTQDLVFVLGDDSKIDTLVRIATAGYMRQEAQTLASGTPADMNNSFIRMNDVAKTRYQVLDRTNVFAIDNKGGMSASTVAKYQASLVAGSTVKAFVLTDAQVTDLINRKVLTDRNRITDKSDIAHTIVFIDLTSTGIATDGEIVLVNYVYTARTPHYVVGQLADNVGKGSVERIATGTNLGNMNTDDIVSLNLTKNDDKLVKDFEVLIAGTKVKTDSYKVIGGEIGSEYSRTEYRRLRLQDAKQLAEYEAALKAGSKPNVINFSTEYWLVRNAAEFGTITIDSVVTFHQNANKDIDVIRVYGKNTPVTAKAAASVEKGIVTDINNTATPYSFAVDNTIPYFLNAKSVLVDKNGNVLALGQVEILGANMPNRLVVGDQVEATVSGDVMTIRLLARKAEVDANLELKKAQNAVTAAELSKEQADVDAAQLLVSALPAGTIKTGLQARLTAIVVNQTPVQAAQAAVTKAKLSRLQADYDAAQALITKLPIADRGALQAQLNLVTPYTAEEAATAAVTKAQTSKLKADIDAAQALVTALPAGTVRTSLQAKLNLILPASAVEEAVAKAEASKLQADIDAAQVLVNALAAGPVKVALQVRLDAIMLPVDAAVVAATAAVVKAEGSKTQLDKDAAQALVTALPAGQARVDLQTRIDAITVVVVPVGAVKWDVKPFDALVRIQGKLNVPAGKVINVDVVVKNNGDVVTLQADGSFELKATEVINKFTVEINGVEDATLYVRVIQF